MQPRIDSGTNPYDHVVLQSDPNCAVVARPTGKHGTLLLTPAQTAALQDWFLPERVGPLVGPHVIATGRGWVDRWPAPRAVDNAASLLVAEKLGLRVDRLDVSYVIGIDIPA